MKEQTTPSPQRIAASYARKSDSNQQALKDQHSVNSTAANRDGFYIPAHLCFEDDDTSGVTTRRKGWDKMMNMAESENPPFERLYAVKMDRVGRYDDPGYHDYVRIHLAKHNVELRYSQDPNPDYSKGMTSENSVHSLQTRMLAIHGSKERHNTRERTLAGIRNTIKNGFYPGTTAPYATVRCLAHEDTRAILRDVPDGYRIRVEHHHFLLRWKTDGTVEIVKRIFNMLDLEDLSLQNIAATLQAEGIPCPRSFRKKKASAPGTDSQRRTWNRKAVRYILRNPIYLGDLLWDRHRSELPPVLATVADPYGKEPILYSDFISDPPISREQFTRVQEKLDERAASCARSRHSRLKYLLSGRLKCAVCEDPWNGHESSPKRKRRRYYRHGLNSRHETLGGSRTVTCSSKSRYVRAADLERQVITDVLLKICTDDVRAGVVAELQRQAFSTELDERKLAEIDRKISDATGHLQQASLMLSQATNNAIAAAHQATLETHAGTLATLEQQRTSLVLARERAEAAQQNLHRTMPTAAELLKQFRNSTDKEQKAILRTLIDRIDLDADNQAVTVSIVLGVAQVERKKTTGKKKQKTGGHTRNKPTGLDEPHG